MVLRDDDLLPETKEKLGLKNNEKSQPMVKPQVIALGAILQSLKGLTNRQALWALRTAILHVRGYKKDKSRNPNTIVVGRKRKNVDDRQ